MHAFGRTLRGNGHGIGHFAGGLIVAAGLGGGNGGFIRVGDRQFLAVAKVDFVPSGFFCNLASLCQCKAHVDRRTQFVVVQGSCVDGNSQRVALDGKGVALHIIAITAFLHMDGKGGVRFFGGQNLRRELIRELAVGDHLACLTF